MDTFYISFHNNKYITYQTHVGVINLAVGNNPVPVIERIAPSAHGHGMSESNLQALLSTKAALDLGLVTQADYDAVKSSFLKAQQLRAAVDAGLMKEDDFEGAKGEYLASLSLQAAPTGARSSAPANNGAASRPAAPAPAPAAKAAPPAPPPAPVAASPAPAPAPPPPAPAPAPPAPPARPASAGAAAIPGTTSNPNVPSNIPKVAGAKPLTSGVSMSGISVSEDAVNLYYLIRARSTYRWALWRIDDSGTQVVVADVGEPGSSYTEFLGALPENDCRYGVFDYQFTTPNGHVMNKLVFMNWSPDSAKVKSKMMYASTKDFFKGHLDGISAEFQASELDEVTEQEVGEAVGALKR